MGVNIDPTWCHQESGSVDLTSRFTGYPALVGGNDLDDETIIHCNVADEAIGARPIDDGSAPDDQIERWFVNEDSSQLSSRWCLTFGPPTQPAKWRSTSSLSPETRSPCGVKIATRPSFSSMRTLPLPSCSYSAPVNGWMMPFTGPPPLHLPAHRVDPLVERVVQPAHLRFHVVRERDRALLGVSSPFCTLAMLPRSWLKILPRSPISGHR